MNRQKESKRYYLKYKAQILKKQKLYKKSNKLKISLSGKLYYKKNKQKILYKVKQYYKRYSDIIKMRSQKYKKIHKNKIKSQYSKYYKQAIKYKKMRYRKDKLFRLITNLRIRVNKALKNNQKSGRTLQLLGCSVSELKNHLEKQFTSGMTWDNYGFYGWHIDHIRPCASFDLTKVSEQQKCFNYTNLQPLWAEENLRKQDKFNDANISTN